MTISDELKNLSDEELEYLALSGIGTPAEKQLIKDDLDRREYVRRAEAFRTFLLMPVLAPAYLIKSAVDFLSLGGQPPANPPVRPA
jgi:hypothetical protein